jgi:hypothetical protein
VRKAPAAQEGLIHSVRRRLGSRCCHGGESVHATGTRPELESIGKEMSLEGETSAKREKWCEIMGEAIVAVVVVR